MKLAKLLSVAAVSLLCASVSQVQAAPTNLIVNGNFDTPNVFPGYAFFPSITGWTVNQDAIEVDTTTILGLACVTAGCQNEEVDANTFDAIKQTVTGLVPGMSYTLSWLYGDRPGSGPQQLNVSFGGIAVTSDFGSGSGVWSTNTFTVIATSTSEDLVFAAVDTSGLGGAPSVGNAVTAVSLTAAPEPASILLVGSGLLGMGMLRRKRR